MALKSRSNIKKKGFRRFLLSFKNSFEGLQYAYRNEQSLLIHAVSSGACILLGIVLKLQFHEWAIILISLGVTLSFELINTAIEATVDLITLKIHPLAKIAKDCGSAATFIASMLSIIIALIIFGSKIIKLF